MTALSMRLDYGALQQSLSSPLLALLFTLLEGLEVVAALVAATPDELLALATVKIVAIATEGRPTSSWLHWLQTVTGNA